MNADEQRHLLDNLQGLLEKQIKMACQGNLHQVEVLAEQTGHIVDKMVKIKRFDQPELDDQHKHLLKLYKKLEMMLMAGKASVETQLRQVGNVLKTIEAYRNSS